jgi:hypothetical protein
MIWNNKKDEYKKEIVIDQIGQDIFVANFYKSETEEVTFVFTLNIDSVIKLFNFIELVKINYGIEHLNVSYS